MLTHSLKFIPTSGYGVQVIRTGLAIAGRGRLTHSSQGSYTPGAARSFDYQNPSIWFPFACLFHHTEHLNWNSSIFIHTGTSRRLNVTDKTDFFISAVTYTDFHRHRTTNRMKISSVCAGKEWPHRGRNGQLHILPVKLGGLPFELLCYYGGCKYCK